MNKSKPSLEELVSKESSKNEKESLPEGKAQRSRTKRKSGSSIKQYKVISFKPLTNGKYSVEIPKSINVLGTEAEKEIKRKEKQILYDMLKTEKDYEDFFSQPNREKLTQDNLQDLREHIHNNLHKNSVSKDKIPNRRIFITVSEDFTNNFDQRLKEGASQEGASQEGASQEGASQEGASQEGFQELPEEGASQEGSQEPPESPKQNMIVLYDNAQKTLANVGIETPLDNLLLPRDLKERFLANPDDSIDDVIREASKNYAINVYRQRYKDIEDNSFKSFLEDAINEGLINPYKYFDKNREERVMYLFGDKALTEPELREEFNKYRFKNLIKGSKNKLHEAAERAIMKKREKQLKAYEEMKQTTHDEIRPKMVLNPMLFNHA